MQYSVGDYLCQQLQDSGIKHIFGVPGDYIFELLHKIEDSDITFVGTCNELNAGYAADAYARLQGLGCVLITYAVGGLSLVNAVAGAYAENVPLVIISGGPSLVNYRKQLQMHHTIGAYDIPLNIFKNITVDSACITDLSSAASTINRLLSRCKLYSKPVYLEIPSDMVTCLFDITKQQKYTYGHSLDLEHCVNKTVSLLKSAKQPIILVGLEVQRYQLQHKLLNLIEATGLPYATFVTDKATLPEQHSQFIGLCGPGIEIQANCYEYLINADCILCIGSQLAKDHLHAFLLNSNHENTIFACNQQVHFSNKVYSSHLRSFISGLYQNLTSNNITFRKKYQYEFKEILINRNQKNISHDSVCARIAQLVDQDDVLIVDSGSSLIKARKYLIANHAVFISQPYYASLGYSLPAAVGACLAKPEQRVCLIIGDGAFQFTCQALSTLIKYKLRLTIFVMNNAGYTIERALFKDADYNNIQPWAYHKMPIIFGGEQGHVVKTEQELENAITCSNKHSGVVVIEVLLDKQDYCANLADIIEP